MNINNGIDSYSYRYTATISLTSSTSAGNWYERMKDRKIWQKGTETRRNEKSRSNNNTHATTHGTTCAERRAASERMKQLKTTRRGKLKNSFKDQSRVPKWQKQQQKPDKSLCAVCVCVCKRKRRSDATNWRKSSAKTKAHTYTRTHAHTRTHTHAQDSTTKAKMSKKNIVQ